MKASDIQTLIDTINKEWGIIIVRVGRRYAYYADETSSWWYVSTEDIADAPLYFGNEAPYSLWCASCLSSREVPSRTLRKYRLA